MNFRALSLAALALALSACGKGGFNRNAPDEFAVSRQAPLVVPPDYTLVPPAPGSPRPLGTDSPSQAIEILFGSGVQVAPKTPGEEQLLDKAGAAKPNPGARSTAGDNQTSVVDKGVLVRDILAAPAGSRDEQVAQVSTGS